MKPVLPSSASQPGRPGHGRPRVVIIGCGFGGLEAAKALDGAAVDIVVVDRTNHHLFQPLLYQVATAGLSAPAIAAPIRHVLRKQIADGQLTVLMLAPSIQKAGHRPWPRGSFMRASILPYVKLTLLLVWMRAEVYSHGLSFQQGPALLAFSAVITSMPAPSVWALRALEV